MTGTLTVKGGTVTGDGFSFGIFLIEGNFELKNGTVNASAGTASFESTGVSVCGDFKMSGGSLTVSGDDFAVFTLSAVIPADYVIRGADGNKYTVAGEFTEFEYFGDMGYFSVFDADGEVLTNIKIFREPPLTGLSNISGYIILMVVFAGIAAILCGFVIYKRRLKI